MLLESTTRIITLVRFMHACSDAHADSSVYEVLPHVGQKLLTIVVRVDRSTRIGLCAALLHA